VTNVLLIYGEIFAHFPSYIRKALLIYDFASDPIRISLYMRKIFVTFANNKFKGPTGQIRAAQNTVVSCGWITGGPSSLQVLKILNEFLNIAK
jgi:hypothetical protein